MTALPQVLEVGYGSIDPIRSEPENTAQPPAVLEAVELKKLVDTHPGSDSGAAPDIARVRTDSGLLYTTKCFQSAKAYEANRDPGWLERLSAVRYRENFGVDRAQVRSRLGPEFRESALAYGSDIVREGPVFVEPDSYDINVLSFSTESTMSLKSRATRLLGPRFSKAYGALRNAMPFDSWRGNVIAGQFQKPLRPRGRPSKTESQAELDKIVARYFAGQLRRVMDSYDVSVAALSAAADMSEDQLYGILAERGCPRGREESLYSGLMQCGAKVDREELYAWCLRFPPEFAAYPELAVRALRAARGGISIINSDRTVAESAPRYHGDPWLTMRWQELGYSDRLAHVRSTLGLNLDGFADLIDHVVSASAISRYESGQRQPHPRNARLIEEKVGAPPGAIFPI